MTDHPPPPAVEAIGRLEAVCDQMDVRLPVAFTVAHQTQHAADLRLVLESLRHSVEREAGLREALEEAERLADRAWRERCGAIGPLWTARVYVEDFCAKEGSAGNLDDLAAINAALGLPDPRLSPTPPSTGAEK